MSEITNTPPNFDLTVEALNVLKTIEIVQGGRNGPTIILKDMIEKMNAEWNKAEYARGVADSAAEITAQDTALLRECAAVLSPNPWITRELKAKLKARLGEA
jgi:hypothetical protein